MRIEQVRAGGSELMSNSQERRDRITTAQRRRAVTPDEVSQPFWMRIGHGCHYTSFSGTRLTDKQNVSTRRAAQSFGDL
ncbi:hypothetical protein ACIA5G_52460 [Amycolatopsis sp. NPDC051758]|uniref:hypothetical protein n=1 Tax=Amycolatopsis sp. NPDC051758 TaxID=3363935 RepID=UPI0037ACE285